VSLAALPAPRDGARPAPDASGPRPALDCGFESVLAPPGGRRLVLWLLVALIAFAAAALALLKVDVVVAANGRIATGEREIVVQPLETSVVRSIAVNMGEQVKAGEVLATLDPTFTQADQNELTAKLRGLDAAFDRLAAELAGGAYDPRDPNLDELIQRDVFRRRHDEYAAKLAAAGHKIEQYQADLAARQAEAASLRQQIELSGEAVHIYKQLVAKDLASKLKLIDASQHQLDAEARLDDDLGDQQKLAGEIAEAQADRAGFVEEWRRKLAEEIAQTRSERDGAAARLAKARMRAELTVMRAPEDAIVLDVADRPPGSVLREAETLMRLVPSRSPLFFDVEVDTRDVARLHVGDRATIKLEALPWQQYGLAYGDLVSLTPDTLADDNPAETRGGASPAEPGGPARQGAVHYRARIALSTTKFRNLPAGFGLRPGMRVVCDIKIGRRSILQYVLNPLTRIIGESLREP
jgi:membrane fusion protein, hemolysin D